MNLLGNVRRYRMSIHLADTDALVFFRSCRLEGLQIYKKYKRYIENTLTLCLYTMMSYILRF